MSVLKPPSLFLYMTDLSSRSSRNQGYDSGESRRSPRDRSPGRYNDSRGSDQYRGSSIRGGERRRSIDDARTINHGAFASNRDNFRDAIGRDSSRDFPPRDAPRGPKALIDAPSGPRASSYGGDFRGDFGFRGDFRGGRGSRGRGRGWRDDSRDRGRDVERDYRDRRDDRAPPPFRDDRSRDRDRWDRDTFRGRRPSSPPGRSRSPNYASRDPRDAPPNLDLDRARRGSRDGPISASSPSSDSLQPFGRGYSRARGGSSRGRGRGYYEEYNRPSGRSRSPDPNWGRRTQPSATPPPQVPAFGSTSSNLPAASTAPSIIAPSSASISGPVAGVSIPTAPRSQRVGRPHLGAPTLLQWVNIDRKEDHNQQPDVSSPAKDLSPLSALSAPEQASEVRQTETADKRKYSSFDEQVQQDASHDAVKQSDLKLTTYAYSLNLNKKRKPTIGKRGPIVPAPALHESTDEGSDSDSADDFGDDYFEDEITKAKDQVTEVENKPKLESRPECDAIFVKPFMESAIDETIAATKSDEVDACPVPPQPWPIPFHEQDEPLPEFRMTEVTLALKPRDKGKSRPTTPLPEVDTTATPSVNGQDAPDDQDESVETASRDKESHGASIIVPPISSNSIGKQGAADRVIEPKLPTTSLPNGRVGRVAPMMDQFEESDDDQTEAEKLESLKAVRMMMNTPPLSSLPKFNCKRWDQDPNFLKTLEPNPIVENLIRKMLNDAQTRRHKEQEEERQAWKERYFNYRRWTDFSDEPVAVRSREKFAKSRAKAVADAAAPPPSLTPAPGTKPEGQRRTGSRFATEHDFERVLRESEQEARETKEREERAARAKTASAKEAIIPDMWWDEEERLKNIFLDRSHLVAFERSFARLEFGAPIDNFTEEECDIFEKLYLEFPKQWGKIAEALPQRDYKACIQHYYLVKHSSNIKEKLKKQPKKKKGRMPKGPKPKSNALMADLGNRDDAEDGQEAENGERRRPRRAAAPTWSFEDTKGDSDVATPAPTPGRKTAVTPKGENGNETAPTKKKAKVTREKGSKQSKNSQLLAAAPVPTNRQGESPAPSISTPDWKNHRESGGASRFPPQYDGASQLQPSFAPPYVPVDRPSTSMTANFDFIGQPVTGQDRLDSAQPVGFDSPQNQRNIQQTSSYWSVPEQTDFPALLKHFGTDWHGIAKFMTSKTHIMVYTTVFQQWLAVPSDSNKSRRVANIQTQVKNYYQRQVDSGKMTVWEEIAREADEKRARGESTGPVPTPSLIPKRRYDGLPGSIQRSGSTMDGIDDLAPQGPNIPLQQGSPQQPILSARFPALAQAGPVPQTLSQPATPTSLLSKHSAQPPPQQAPQQIQQPRPSRGPALGYFNTDSQRPIMQASNVQKAQHTTPAADSAVSQRSLMAAQQAQLEQQQALRTIQIQEQQQQALQRERQIQMKQENETPNLHQYEPYSTPSMHPNPMAHTRTELPQSAAPSELRRTAPPQQYQPRSHQAVRSLLSDNPSGGREMKSSPSPAIPRAPLSAPPTSQEPYSAIPPQLPPAPAPRPQEPVRKSNIMSLLNDEPSDPRPPPKRVSDVPSSSLQTSQTPPPQHPLQTSRYSAQPSQPTSQPPQQMSQQMSSQLPPQQQQPLPQSHHPYAQASPHPMHQHSSSMGASRSFTPTGFESRSFGQPPPMQQQQQQQMYSQPARQSMAPQAPQIRREPSHSEMHGLSSGYSRTSAPSQPSTRLKESPYSATPPPPPPQTGRQQVKSPLDLAPPSEHDYYPRPSQYMVQQQSSSASSPQLGPYHPQAQQQPSHRQITFGPGFPHTASPPTHNATQHPVHRSRQNSFDGRYPMATSAPTPSQQGYSQAPHQPPPLGMQYHQQQQPVQERFENYEMERERERRMQEDAYLRRLDESRR
jgi:hypothetical protein